MGQSSAEMQLSLLNEAVRRNYESQNDRFKSLVAENSQLLALMKSMSDN